MLVVDRLSGELVDRLPGGRLVLVVGRLPGGRLVLGRLLDELLVLVVYFFIVP